METRTSKISMWVFLTQEEKNEIPENLFKSAGFKLELPRTVGCGSGAGWWGWGWVDHSGKVPVSMENARLHPQPAYHAGICIGGNAQALGAHSQVHGTCNDSSFT